MPHRPLAAGLALLLLVSACGSDGTDTADTAAPAVTEAAGASTGATDTDTATDTADTGNGRGAAADSLPPTAVDDLVASFGAEPTPELLGCLEERGIGDEVAAGSNLNQVGAALMGCAPDEMGAIMAQDLAVPGVEPDQVRCVMAELAAAVGALSAEEAAVALESVDIPDNLRASVSEDAPSACDLTAEQVDAVLTS